MASTRLVLSSISDVIGPDAEVHSAIVDRVTRISRDGSASNHYQILRRATAILNRMLQLLESGGDDGAVAKAMPGYVNRHHTM